MFDTGDDCIAIDSGKGRDTQFGPAKNIYIKNCTMQGGHGGITIGSIMSGGVENIYVENIELQNKNWNSYPLNVAVRIKSNMNRGGYVRNVHIRNINIPNGVRTMPGWYVGRPESGIPRETVATSAGGVVTIECAYDPNADNVRTRPPKVSDIFISNIKVGKNFEAGSKNTSYQAVVLLGPVVADYNGKMNGLDQIYPISNVHIEDSDFGWPVNGINPIYLHNSKDIYFKNVKISGQVFNRKLESLR
jgi:polygalacturonase